MGRAERGSSLGDQSGGAAEELRMSPTRLELLQEDCVPSIANQAAMQRKPWLQRARLDIHLPYQRVSVALSQLVEPTSVLSLSLRTPRSTPVKLSSAAMVSILVNWFSRMAEPTALSDS